MSIGMRWRIWRDRVDSCRRCEYGVWSASGVLRARMVLCVRGCGVSLVFLHVGNGDFEREVRMSEAFHPVSFQEVL